ncbi:S8 family serine peptidase [Candidatus Dojkabacteria bacterium]|nr:S8 family serine peptidase [Candidatus Dojkabacteria bacterium]
MHKSFFEARKKTKHLFIIFLTFVLTLSFSPAPIQKVNAEDSSFPKMGGTNLSDPEAYEEAGLIQKAGIFLSGSTPTKIETLDKTYYGFSISGNIEGIIVRVKKGDDTFTKYLKIESEDVFMGDDTSFDTSKNSVSDLFIFSEGVKEIEFYYDGEKEFIISKYEFNSTSDTSFSIPEEFASTQAERAYKEKLFSQMGFDLITREEWGAPTASPWAPTIANVNRIVVHHTATSVDMANPKNTVMAVYNYHYNRCSDNSGSWPNCTDPSKGTWTDVGYNYMIDPYGNIYEGRSGGNGVVGAHAVPNTGSIGISILGNYVSQDPTQASMEALTKLISALSQLNNFNAVWQGGDPKSGTGLYGHRDLAATACPGRIYNQLETVASRAVQMKPLNSNLRSADAKRNNLIDNRNYIIDGTKARVALNSSQSNALTKEKLLTLSRGVESLAELGNKIIYKVDNSKIDQLIGEILLVAPETNPQPIYIYKTESWNNTDPERSIPSDYDTATHWTAEKTKLPEAWKEMGGCTSDNSCGGDPSVVVAVLDTGASYENYVYDAGNDNSYTVGKFNGIYLEYPTNNTQDGTFVNGSYKGYERQYSQSSELSGVNIVSPYDAVQDYFCMLRAIDGNPANDCNANELAKIDHANDDYGHGTLVTTILAGRTGDTAPNKVIGIAHNASIMPIKVFYPNDRSMCQDASGNLDLTCSNSSKDYRTVADSFVISQAIEYAVANGADVINMSLRGVGTDPMMQVAINDAVNAGVVVVAAAGNDNSDIANYFPASFPNVIAVGATDANDNRASYSNYGDELDLVAPVGDSGPQIASQSYSCYPNKNNCSDETNVNLFNAFTSNTSPTTVIGTSFAAPQVSAAVALMKSIHPNITPIDINIRLRSSAQDVASSGFDTQTGYGLLQLDNSLVGYTERNLDTKYYFPWYDDSDIGIPREAWLIIANQSQAEVASIEVWYKGVLEIDQTLAPGERITPQFNEQSGGPIVVNSTNGIPIYSSVRVRYNESFEEITGFPSSELANLLYFPWYDDSDDGVVREAWIIAGIPETVSANVDVTVQFKNTSGQVILHTQSASPGESTCFQFDEQRGGPVKITAVEKSTGIPVNIYSSQRVKFMDSFNEIMAVTNSDIESNHFFPWYDDSENGGIHREAYILIGNPNDSNTSVTLRIPGQPDKVINVYANSSNSVQWDELCCTGSIVVTSTQPIYATQRVRYINSFNETKSIDNNKLNKKQFYTWYDDSDGGGVIREAWILIGNPSINSTAIVIITVQGVIIFDGRVNPGQTITPQYNEQTGGPVIIYSDQNIFTTQRVRYNNSFSELNGI